MKLLITIFVAVTSAASALFAGPAEDLTARLQQAAAAGDHAAAASWASALKDVRAAEVLQEQRKAVETTNKVFAVYGNAVKSAPALFAGMEAYGKLSKESPSSEIWDFIAVAKAAMKLFTAPVTEAEATAVATQLYQREQLREKEREERRKRYLQYNN